MGLFSWQCRGCEKSLLSIHATTKKNSWMVNAVALAPDGESMIIGEYDGYGHINGADLTYGTFQGSDLWHHDCWIKGGKAKYQSEAEYADDQGYFFDECDYDMASPLK